MAFGRTDVERNTSNPEETMERMTHSPHLDAHDRDSQTSTVMHGSKRECHSQLKEAAK
jgi:hypothetical protein